MVTIFQIIARRTKYWETDFQQISALIYPKSALDLSAFVSQKRLCFRQDRKDKIHGFTGEYVLDKV